MNNKIIKKHNISNLSFCEKLNKNTINQIYNLLNKQDKINKDSMWFAILNNYHVNFLKFVKQDKKKLEEQNLKTVILLNPKNEEAIYNLAKLKLLSSDFQKSRELNKRLKLICRSFCLKSDKLKIEIENLSKK